jgi:hypothetical protein
MNIKDRIVGKWETKITISYYQLLSITVIYIAEFRKNGSLVIVGKYKNPVLQSIMALWDVKAQGTYWIDPEDKLHVNLKGLSSYPTRLIDQALKSLKIQISVDELVSILSSSFFTLVGANSENGLTVNFLDENRMKLGEGQVEPGDLLTGELPTFSRRG